MHDLPRALVGVRTTQLAVTSRRPIAGGEHWLLLDELVGRAIICRELVERAAVTLEHAGDPLNSVVADHDQSGIELFCLVADRGGRIAVADR